MNFPDGNALMKALEVANHPESANYLLERCVQAANKLGIADKVQELLDNVRNFVGAVEKESKSLGKSPWTGDKGQVLFTKLQQLSEAVTAEVKASLNNNPQLADQVVALAYAMNEQSQLQRGFSVEGKLLDEDSTVNEQLENLYNTWLSKNNLSCEDNVVYEVSDGKKEKISPAKFVAAIENPSTGFEAMVNSGSSKLRINVVHQEYQKQTASPEAS